MNHREWLGEVIGADSYRAAAARIDIDQSTIAKQLSRGVLSPQNVIALARAYGRKAGVELVRTGYLRADDIDGVGVVDALRQASSKQVLAELDSRLT
ncbi:hypothetical protein [Rhodococcus marinonascens]|uniref:hypothetical protein n=1 Tax=Rhodococcus marinonascens TaxID=38311 RepID=UPI000933CC48|nr:hypothetical protein [Rhodococcus marinonascens]